MAKNTQKTIQPIHAPQEGEMRTIDVTPDAPIKLSQEFEQAEPRVEGASLIFTFANGGQVVLDFSDLGQAALPNIVLADGTVLSVDEYLRGLGLQEIETAAGPGTQSGGVGAYEDDPGDIIDGVAKLGGLDPRDFPAVTDEELQGRGDDAGQATILDNDEPVPPTPAVSVSDVQVDEGQDAVFTVSVTNAAPGSTVTLTLADGTAVDADYNEARFQFSTDGTTWSDVTGPIDVPDGSSTLLVRTDTVDDASDEPDETFSLSATLSTGQNDAGQATILDNDEPADDQPTVKSFTHTLVEDGDAYDVSGDALSGSSLGNGTAMEHAFVWTTAPTAAQYGTVTLNPDGTYSYTLDNTNPEVDALQANQQLTETFLYTYTDTDGDEATGSVTITITGANDAPVVYPDTNWAMDATTPGGENEHILAVGNVLVSSPHSGAPDGLDRGDVKDQDVDATDTLSVIQIRLGNAGADLPVQSATTFEDGTIIQGLYGTLSIGADGSYVYVVDFDHPDVNRLNVGEHLLDVFTYTATDGSLPRETTLSIAVFGTDDPPVFSPAIETWVPLDSTQTTPGYELGYPITLDIQDVDSSFGIRFIASLPDGDAQADGRLVYYENGESVDVTAGTVFEYEAIPQIYYIPPAGVELTSTYLDSVSYEIVDSDSGMVSGTGIVNIHAVPPAAIAGPTAQIGDGTNPLNSGSDQKFTITFANDTGMNFINSLQNNLDDAHLTMYTDFQVAPFTVPVDAGSQDGLFLEQQVQVRLEIDGQTFLVKNASAMDSDTWAYDSETGLMKAVVDFDDIMLAFDNDPNKNKDDWQVDPHGEGPGNTLTLAEYLTAHPASPTDTWILIYNDTTGGSEQARFVSFAFSANQEGDDSVVVTGTSGLPNFIFGSDTGNDILTGADMDDTIIGRGGNDTLSGQGGDDILLGGAGSDTFRYTAGDVGDGHDTIMDFHVAPLDAEGDVLDFTGGLTGATLDNISSFLEFRNISQNPDGSTKADLFVDQNGSAGGTDFASIATVHMTGVGDAESGTEILNAMIENNSIKIA